MAKSRNSNKQSSSASGDRVLVTIGVSRYAGHGRSIEFYGMNYWLPYDAEEQEIRTWIPSSMVSGALGRIPARHILLLNDSCFSGDQLRVRRNFRERKPGYEETAKRYRAREVLTSGMSEPVTDARGLYDYVKRGVVGQTPLYGTLHGHQEGGACLLCRQGEPSPGNSISTSAYWGRSENSERTEGVTAVPNREEPTGMRVYKCPICGLRNREEEKRQAARRKLENGLVPMKYVEGGSFQMGSEDGDAYKNERQVHRVQVDSFYMGIYPVTQEQYQKVMSENPSYFDSESDSNSRPVEQVSWYDAVVFCNRMSTREGLEPVYELGGSSDPDRWGPVPEDDPSKWDSLQVNWEAKGYRLPTEDEWEYAACGGNQSQGYTYAGSNSVGDVAWYGSNSSRRTHPVGEKRPNELGLHDMSGNVWEWCWDWYDDEYYEESPAVNPTGLVSGSNRVLRGGSWFTSAQIVRSASRNIRTPSIRSLIIGFRVLVPTV